MGTYEGICAEFCGLQHANMKFNVVVDSSDSFKHLGDHAAAVCARALAEAASQLREPMSLRAQVVLPVMVSSVLI